MKDQYLINLQFVEEILEFVCLNLPLLYEYKELWYPKFEILDLANKTDVLMFHDDVGCSVLHIIDKNMEDIEDCFYEFLHDMRASAPMNEVDDAYFTKSALNIAPFFFSKGYSHESFLAFCAMVMGVAHNFLLLEQNRIPQRACHVIGLVLFMHQMTGEFYKKGGWKGFRDVCSNFNECQKRKGKR
ncbi:hypothetical protein HNY73_008711 [Argiope bruennichi]|uniref:Uncharacterized protein n=2 Tax=Argiope bruennichi TaxID=94029 RepID=A0A8T0FCN3_ARGBR|nr:hypothetical protein HNY73_008711 [Argiope bruennichi]